MLSLLHLEGGTCTLMENRVTKRFALGSSREPTFSFDQRVALTPVGNCAGSRRFAKSRDTGSCTPPHTGVQPPLYTAGCHLW